LGEADVLRLYLGPEVKSQKVIASSAAYLVSQ